MITYPHLISGCTSSPSLKYFVFYSKYQIQLYIPATKQRIPFPFAGTTYIYFNQSQNILIFNNFMLQITIYSISARSIIKKYKDTNRLIKSLYLYPEGILMTLSSKGLLEEYYLWNKVVKQIKGALWDDERNYDFVYSQRYKLLILALKSGELIFKNKQLLTKVYIHTPFHSLTLNPTQNLLSAVCRNQIFIFQIFTQKRYYLPIVSPINISWMDQGTIVALSNQKDQKDMKNIDIQKQVKFWKQQEYRYQKVISIWNVKKQMMVKEKVVSEYAWKLIGEGDKVSCVYLTVMEEENEAKKHLVEWFEVKELVYGEGQEEMENINVQEEKQQNQKENEGKLNI